MLHCPCVWFTPTHCRKCLLETGTVVCFLMKFQLEIMSVSIRSLNVLCFENYGTERTCSIANYALLFVVCGLHWKWRQPVAYNFNRGCTKANFCVKFLNGVLGACQNGGLHVTATVCDMGTNSVKALILLCATRCKQFLKFKNQDMVKDYNLHTCSAPFLKYNV